MIFAHAHRINIADINAPGTFSRGTGEIRFNIESDRRNSRGPFYTFFHELGHMIDFYIGNDRNISGIANYGTMFSGERSQWAQEAYDAGRRDVRNQLNSVADDILSQPPFNEIGIEIVANPPFAETKIVSPRRDEVLDLLRQRAVSNIMRGERVEEGQAITYSQRLQLEIQEQMQDMLEGASMHSVRNVFGGFTNEGLSRFRAAHKRA